MLGSIDVCPTGLASLRRLPRRAARLCFALCLLATSACKLDEKPPPGGGLVVAIDTDMSMPKDVDELRLEVTQGVSMLFQHTQKLTEGTSRLPLEFQVPQAQDSSPVLVRAVGLKDGAPRVERSAITTVPTTYLGYLRLILNYLCDGMVGPLGESNCGDTMTCIQGTCESAAIAGSLPDFYQRDAANMMQSASTACFNVTKCMSDATEIMPDPADDCSFKSSKLFATDINVGLRLNLGSEGICTRTHCWVILDSDGNGFRTGNDDRVFLPKSICELRSQGANLLVAMSMQCPSKTQSQPLCRDEESMPALGDPDNPITVGTNGSPVSDACAGGGGRACEMCGSQARMCNSGLWTEFGMCMDQGVCVPEVSEPCGVNGIRTCGGDCTWGDCENQTCEGAATRACGNCGTQHRSCNNGVWTEWSLCGDEGECLAGATQACGSGGTQACEGNCRWSACTMQACDGAASGPCGNCGTQERTCDPNTATWSEFGACADEGECRPDTTMACGRDGEQTCGGNCRWDASCTGQTCEGPARRACGLCGTQTRTCDMNTGEYSDWSACFGEGECMPDARASCGSGGERTCGGSCRWGAACTGQVCTGASSQRCGDCGTRTRSCNTNTGEWSGWSECLNEGDCTAGETRTCGSGGTQTCLDSCRWDTACPGQMCDGQSSRVCPNNQCITQTRTCDTSRGVWNGWTPACTAGCVPGTTAPEGCTDPNAVKTCTNACIYGSTCTCATGFDTCPSGCVDLGEDERNCGKCGMACLQGQTCNDGTCECPIGQILCGEGAMRRCVNVNGSDNANCGACGNTCGGGSACMGGTCRCPTRNGVQEEYCEETNTCEDLQGDFGNCGDCGNRCNVRQVCTAGECVCEPGYSPCNNAGNSAGCVNLQIDENHCGECFEKCQGTDMCIEGDCLVTCTGANQMRCGNTCVDPDTSNQHCGGCNMACEFGMTCQGGDCACPSGTMQCGGSTSQCVATNTTMHCGGCAACPSGQACDATTRTCGCSGMNPDECSGTCTNLDTDEQHCGTCPNVCPMTATCVDGACDCPGNQRECSGACVDTQTNPNHCGGCGESCMGQGCTGGVCDCPANQDRCPGSGCVDTRNDPNNCGTCGRSCGGRDCSGSMCVCTAAEHRCSDGSCETRSAASCTSGCIACPPRNNARILGCTDQDTCDYACIGPECGGGCCAAGEDCVANQCVTPTPPMTPVAGAPAPP